MTMATTWMMVGARHSSVEQVSGLKTPPGAENWANSGQKNTPPWM
jgi:hypothetical protein